MKCLYLDCDGDEVNKHCCKNSSNYKLMYENFTSINLLKISTEKTICWTVIVQKWDYKIKNYPNFSSRLEIVFAYKLWPTEELGYTEICS